MKAALVARLGEQPTTPTRAVKRLRPNPLVEFELRVGDFRVLYNVEGSEVILLVLGRKVGNKLIVKGEEFLVIRTIPLSQLEADPRGTINECADSAKRWWFSCRINVLSRSRLSTLRKTIH